MAAKAMRKKRRRGKKAKHFRNAAEYARRSPNRDQKQTALIVCEGTKSEPNYFRSFCVALRLGNVQVKASPGTDPVTIVEFAREQLQYGGYDRVFCVFDRDGHQNYDAALGMIQGSGGRLIAITSWPCFEVWVLLHFIYSSAAYNAVGGDSACDRVVREVKKRLPNYAKGAKDLYSTLAERLDTAIAHGKQLATYNRETANVNPATKVHELVEYLKGLPK